jgi:sensor c-di-GMP phosphodiesterase-like protein
MKSETLNAVLTFILGVLVVAGVVLALRLVFVTKQTRQLAQMVAYSQFNIARAEAVFHDAATYNQKASSPELNRILQLVQKPKSASH